jgi:hypothetical protein
MAGSQRNAQRLVRSGAHDVWNLILQAFNSPLLNLPKRDIQIGSGKQQPLGLDNLNYGEASNQGRFVPRAHSSTVEVWFCYG